MIFLEARYSEVVCPGTVGVGQRDVDLHTADICECPVTLSINPVAGKKIKNGGMGGEKLLV